MEHSDEMEVGMLYPLWGWWCIWYMYGVSICLPEPSLPTLTHLSWAHEICTRDNEERAIVIGSMNEIAYVMQVWLPLLVWQQVDGPQYRKGFITVTFLSLAFIVSTLVVRMLHERETSKQQNDQEIHSHRTSFSENDSEIMGAVHVESKIMGAVHVENKQASS
jgi:hypothetical protein